MHSKEYFEATEGICDKIALSNWDHFGKVRIIIFLSPSQIISSFQGAIKAYCAFHTAALKKAKEAYEAGLPEVQQTLKSAVPTLQNSLNNYVTTLENAKNDHVAAIETETGLGAAKGAHISALEQATDSLPTAFEDLKAAYQRSLNPKITDNSTAVKKKLKEAYVIEACAQHYLTDLFLAGHIRTPRHELHSVHYSGEVHLMDRFAGLMHDEESANGLKVTNREGKTWMMQDGKWLWAGVENDENLKIAKEAAQTSVNEIWRTRDSGKIPPRFKVLDKVWCCSPAVASPEL